MIIWQAQILLQEKCMYIDFFTCWIFCVFLLFVRKNFYDVSKCFYRSRYVAFVRHAAYQFQQLQQQSQKKSAENKVSVVHCTIFQNFQVNS